MPIHANGKPEHAVYLIHKLLSNAKETVLLFCTNLALTDTSYLAYGSAYVIDVARNFLRNPGAELSIIVRGDVDGGADNHPLIQAVRNEKGNGWMMGRFEVRRLQDGAASDEPDFILVDGNAARIETDRENSKALAVFGDGELGRIASGVFEFMWEGETRTPALVHMHG